MKLTEHQIEHLQVEREEALESNDKLREKVLYYQSVIKDLISQNGLPCPVCNTEDQKEHKYCSLFQKNGDFR